MRCQLDKLILEPIGVIHTPFATPDNIPLQPAGGKDREGWVEVDPRYAEALSDLEGFSHIYLIYHFHRSKGYSLKIIPYLDTEERGLFATRAPKRPNPIGISVVRLKRIEGNKIHICDLDMLDGTPLLDIKPYIGEFDAAEGLRIGWLEGKARHHRSDDRFET